MVLVWFPLRVPSDEGVSLPGFLSVPLSVRSCSWWDTRQELGSYEESSFAGTNDNDSPSADPRLMPSQHKTCYIPARKWFISGLTTPCLHHWSLPSCSLPPLFLGFVSLLPQGHSKLPGWGHQQCKHEPPSQQVEMGCPVQDRAGLSKHVELQLVTLGSCSGSWHQPRTHLPARIFMIPINTKQKPGLL